MSVHISYDDNPDGKDIVAMQVIKAGRVVMYCTLCIHVCICACARIASVVSNCFAFCQ